MVRGKIIPLKPSFKASIHNRFDIEVIDATSGNIRQTAIANNTILNSLWTAFASSPGGFTWAGYIHYGAGSTTPSASDTTLTNFIGQAQATQVSENWDYTTGVYQRKIYITLSETTAVGQTISEVGVATGTAANTLKTKALLKDMNGNPISLSKTDTDIVKIYATIFVHVNTEGYDDGHIQFYSMTGQGMLRCLAGYYYKPSTSGTTASTMPTRLYAPSSTALVEGRGRALSGAADISTISWSFDASTKVFKSSKIRLGATVGNAPKGIPMLALGGDYYRGIDIALWPGGSWYPGTNISGESLGTGDGAKVDFATKFGYITNPKVYVDGVEVTDVTFDINEPVNPKNNYFGQLNQVDSEGAPYLCYPAGDHLTDFNGVYYENPNYETVGITKFLQVNNRSMSVVGGDLGSMVYVGDVGSEIAANHRNYRYYGVSHAQDYANALVRGVYSTETRTTNVHFATPPAEGAVITIDYYTGTIAKDANHVFDFSMEIQLGEYTEAQ